jgi:uncharacterized protein (DUF2164 family)
VSQHANVSEIIERDQQIQDLKIRLLEANTRVKALTDDMGALQRAFREEREARLRLADAMKIVRARVRKLEEALWDIRKIDPHSGQTPGEIAAKALSEE